MNLVAESLHNALMKNIVGPDDIQVGDYIIVTGSTEDEAGIVKAISEQNDNSFSVDLETKAGIKKVPVYASSPLHIVQTAEARAALIELRNHTEYERGLKDLTKRKYPKDGRPEYGPVEDSKKSKLPTSKMSLNLRSKK